MEPSSILQWSLRNLELSGFPRARRHHPTYNDRKTSRPYRGSEKSSRRDRMGSHLVDDNSPDAPPNSSPVVRDRPAHPGSRAHWPPRPFLGVYRRNARDRSALHRRNGCRPATRRSILPTMLNRIKSGAWTSSLPAAACRRKYGRIRTRARLAQQIWHARRRIVCRSEISDAMSGFFLMDRAFFQRVASDLTGTGFKSFWTCFLQARVRARCRSPLRFRNRQRGTSKLDVRSEFEYLHLLVAKVAGERIPSRLFLSVLIGSLGLCVHLGSFTLLHFWARFDFVIAQTPRPSSP